MDEMGTSILWNDHAIAWSYPSEIIYQYGYLFNMARIQFTCINQLWIAQNVGMLPTILAMVENIPYVDLN